MKYDRSKGEAPIICDCHLHAKFSGDSNTSISLQIEKTIELGVKEICITDHHDYDSGFCDCDFILNIPAYLAALRALRANYRDRIRINIGVELGLQEHLKQYLEHFVKRYGGSFDLTIGSNHLIESMDPYDPEYWNSQGGVIGLEDFLEASLVRVRGLYHTLDFFGHLDYAVCYAPHQSDFYDRQHLSQWTDPLLKILIESDRSLECNAGGSKYDLGQPDPCRRILMRYQKLDNEMIAIGFDAHTSEYMGCAFDTCRELLLNCGCKYLIVYYGRKPEFIPPRSGNN